MPRTHWLQAEPLTSAAFAPYGQVVGEDDCAMELRGGEQFHLNVLSYEYRPIQVDHLNRHHKATQMLVSLAGKPWVIVCGMRDLDLKTADQLDLLQAFVCDGSAGINLARGTWHEGPFPIYDRVDLVNVQATDVDNDNEVADLASWHDVVVRVHL